MKASEYKKLASGKQAIEEVPLPTGAVFKMRVAPLQQWITSGVLPASLAARMQKAARVGDPKEANDYVVNNFTEQDFIDSQKLSKRMLEFCCVEPRVKAEPSADGEGADGEGADDCLAPEDIDPADFDAIMKWIWSGGKQGEDLANFRHES